MLNWLVVSNTEVEDTKDPPSVPAISPTLLKDIREFDKDDLFETDSPNRYYFYNLLDEIKRGVKLNHIDTDFPSILKQTLETIIINDRIKNGKHFGSYTYDEYEDAFKQLNLLEISYKYRTTILLGCFLFLISSLGFLSDSNTSTFLYVTNTLFFGSFILSTFY